MTSEDELDMALAAMRQRFDKQLEVFRLKLDAAVRASFEQKAAELQRKMGAVCKKVTDDFSVHFAEISRMRQTGEIPAEILDAQEESIKKALKQLLAMQEKIYQSFIANRQ